MKEEVKAEDSVHAELEGKITFRLKSGRSLDEFCARNFDNYNPDQYEAVALRMYYGKELSITLYALDKVRQEGTNYNSNKIPVKKFKKDQVSLNDIFTFIEDVNFTIEAGNFDLGAMEVINK